MEKFVFLNHVADVLFVAQGFTLEEAMQNAALAMFETIADTSKIKPKYKFEIEERADNLEELAVYALSTMLSIAEAKEMHFKKFEVKSLKKDEKGVHTIKGTAFGDESESENGRTGVKALAMAEAKVWRDNKIWKIQLILDI